MASVSVNELSHQFGLSAVLSDLLSMSLADLRQELAVVKKPTEPRQPSEPPTPDTEKISAPAWPQQHIDSNKLTESDYITPNSTPSKGTLQ